MPRSDRLRDLVQLLRDGGLHRAEDLAARLGVTPRTIYRDMDTLAAAGVPVQGTRGAGYRAQDGVTLPPLTLSHDELEALHLALAILGEAAEEGLRSAAESLSAKVDAVLPEDGAAGAGQFGYATDALAGAGQAIGFLQTIRAAIRARQKLELRLADDPGQRRVMRPLRLDYWGRYWSLTAWCEAESGFRTVALGQITAVRPLPGLFVDEPGKTLADFRAR